MIQSAVNNVENLQDMMTQVASQRSADYKNIGMDKTSDFKKVLGDKLNKFEPSKHEKNPISDTKPLDKSSVITKIENLENTQPINNSDIDTSKKTIANLEDTTVKTLADLKSLLSKVDDNLDIDNFKEILSQATDEANMITSLDLTLAKDINEIISQLKEAIAAAKKDSESIEEVDTEDTDSNNATINIETELPITDESLKEETSDSQSETEEKPVFEQLIAILNKAQNSIQDSSQKSTNLETFKQESVEMISEESTSKTLLDFETLKQPEYLDITTENLSSETTNKTTSNENITELETLLDEDLIKDLKIESLQAETDTTSQEDSLLQHQTLQEQGIKAALAGEVENFELKTDSNINLNTQQTVQTKTTDVNPSRIIEQITKQMQGMQNGSKVNIVLNPESLGKINVQLMNTKEGLMAQLTVTTQEARDLLMKGLDGLKDSLTSQGVGVDQISVKVADAQKSEYNSDWTEQEGSRGGNKEQNRQNKEEKEKGLFEKMMAQIKPEKEENGNV